MTQAETPAAIADELAWLDEHIARLSGLPDEAHGADLGQVVWLGQLLIRRAEVLASDPPASVEADLREARRLLRLAASALPLGDTTDDERLGLDARAALGTCCGYLYEIGGDAADADEAIELLRQVVPSLAGPPDTAEAATQLADMSWRRAQDEQDPTRRRQRLDLAADMLELALDTGHEDRDLWADALALRAVVAEQRWACAEVPATEPAAYEELRSLLVETLAALPADYPQRWQLDWSLASLSHEIHLRWDDPADLDQALRHWAFALDGANRAGEPPAELLGEYASTLATGWSQDDDPQGRDLAISLYERAFEASRERPAMWLIECAVMLNDRAGASEAAVEVPRGDVLADVEAVIRLSSAAAKAAEPDSPVEPEAELLLVKALTDRLRLIDDDVALVAHIDAAIATTETILSAWRHDDRDRLTLTFRLGLLKYWRFSQTLDGQALAESVTLLRTVYDGIPDDDADRSLCGVALALALIGAQHTGLEDAPADEAYRLLKLHRPAGSSGGDLQDLASLAETFDQVLRAGGRGVPDWNRARSTFPAPGGPPRRNEQLLDFAWLMLLMRAFDSGSMHDLEAAMAHQRELRASVDPAGVRYQGATIGMAATLVIGAINGWAPSGLSVVEAAEHAVELIGEVLPAIPGTDLNRPFAEWVLAQANLVLIGRSPHSRDAVARSHDHIGRLAKAVAEAPRPPGRLGASGARIGRVFTALSDGMTAATAPEFDAIVAGARATVAESDDEDGYRPLYRWHLAIALTRAYDRWRQRSHLVEAAGQLRLTVAATQFGPMLRRDAGELLATVLRKLAVDPTDAAGDYARQSRAAAIDQLRSYGELTVLQSTATEAAAVALDAETRAAAAVSWCLDDRAWGDAVRVLEAGRALTLNASMTWASVSERLRLAGHEALAREWAAAGPSTINGSGTGQLPAGSLIPNDIVTRAIDALGTETLTPPQPAAIGAALTSLGHDALVYLIPGNTGRAGHAVMVSASGDVAGRRLPALVDVSGGVLGRYHRVHDAMRATGDPAERGRLRERWTTALDELTSWAWSAAMAEVLRLAPREQPRLVIVPVGRLCGVPWHAARDPLPDSRLGRPQLALDRAVISYAASARLLLDCASRPAMTPDGTALIVGNPTGDERLAWAALEATALWRVFYPRADYYGMVADLGDDRAPQRMLRECSHVDLLAGLPGGIRPRPVVHLSCHAGSPGGSGSVLAARLRIGPGGLALSVAKILRQAAGRPADSPGPLVDLAACGTHLTGDRHDEALTLATAFLVAGASTVLGSLWRVLDRRTALMMFVVHHHLRMGGLPAAEALRRAQLWMLDPARRPVAGMPAAFRDTVPGVDLAEPRGWAAFVHQGR